ncbi:sulfatase-like hydrolase/transferase [Neolewinella aurantiaca]|uniref:Sulfatase-like hydrolase/transferase n=1 Tax=Neolewinella aurantiaca TaxID=2602767 RepID=A0A5C7FJU8_9BACT|nr:sulfatase-like hydrolase/transferase [Neolewinella aurantiaca]TXF87617.1 sulfatase-like hydrolase/transferase [Neolewinella aurantiaca]
MTYRCVFPALLLGLFVCTCAPSPSENRGVEVGKQDVPPNILFILTDDQGVGDLSLHGNDSIRTPNMDALLTSGAQFSRFYVSPVCAPTRASFLSGLYSPRTGAVFVTRRRETMDDGIMTIPEYLKHAGYRTGLFGKWHNGSTKPYDPNGQGFDQFLGFTLGHFNDYFNGELENEDNEVVPFNGDLTTILTDTAAHFMLADQDQPFFCMLTYQAPHTPVQVADKYWNPVKSRGLTDYNTGVYAMIESVDDHIGKLLDQLEAAGKLDNTIVIFSTDNGPNGDRYRMGLKGTKGSVNEGGVRVPFGIRFPNGHPANGRQFHTPAAHIDLVPTLLDIVGLPQPPGGLDGKSLMPLLEPDSSRVFDQNRPIYAFKQGYDFTGYPGSVRNSHRLVVMNSPDDFEAYEIHKDEGQRTNIMASDADFLKGVQGHAREMAAEYNRFAATIARPDLIAPPINLDAAQFRPVHLQAHEGEPLGETHFMDEYGWSNDFFVDLDWNGAYWPVEITQDRTYRVTIHYHAEKNIRLGIQMDSLQQDLKFIELPKAITPQLSVADRVKRKEVYPRQWATAIVEDFTVRAGASELHIFGGYDNDTETGLWIKEVTLQ